MAFQTVTSEVRWVASIGYSGNELPPTKWEVIGEFEDRGDAERALAEAGLTRREWGSWTGGYAHGSIARVLREIEELKKLVKPNEVHDEVSESLYQKGWR